MPTRDYDAQTVSVEVQPGLSTLAISKYPITSPVVMVLETKLLVKAKAFISHVALHRVFVFGLMLHFLPREHMRGRSWES